MGARIITADLTLFTPIREGESVEALARVARLADALQRTAGELGFEVASLSTGTGETVVDYVPSKHVKTGVV